MSYEESKKFIKDKEIAREKEKEAVINIIRILRDKNFTTAQIIMISEDVKNQVTENSYVSKDF